MNDDKKNTKGKVFVVGLGPGAREQMTIKAIEAIDSCDVVIGYHVYIKLIEDLLEGKQVISSGMKREKERCEMCLLHARAGKKVALVSSGDAGIYGMAGPMLEMNAAAPEPVCVEIVPGITAASMAAAVLGAPLMHDTVLISLSDLLTPWKVIEKRLCLAAEGDFVAVLYNPRSQGRPHNIDRAREIFLRYRKGDTIVGIVRNAAREGQSKVITTLEQMPIQEVDMFSVVIIGSSHTYVANEKMLTPRGYRL